MKKILHVSNTDITSDSRILKELASISRLSGIELFAVGLHKSNDAGIRSCRVHGVLRYYPIVLLSRILHNLPRALKYSFELVEFTLRTLIFAAKIRPDIIHCHDTFALPCGWLTKKLFKTKLIYDAHELESNKNGQTEALSRATLWIEKFCWTEVDYLISVSDSILNWYRGNLGAKPSVLVLNSPQFKTSEKDATAANSARGLSVREIFSIGSDSPIFVHVGILGPGRGIDIYLECFARTKTDAHLVIVGDGIFRDKIESYSKRYPNIHFLPPVEHSQVVPLLRSATFGLCLVEAVSLSDYYCLPNKLFEYAFSGITVIASNFPDIGLLVDSYSLGYCCEPNLEALERTVEMVVNLPPANARKSLTPLTWEAQAERLRHVYIEMGCPQ